MELEQTNIKKIITTIDNEKSYSIDVDETTTFYEFKKILAAAAHLLKNCFRIYHEQQEYTNDYDDNTIQEIFPDLDPVPLKIISNKDVYEYEDELISVRFNINVPCQVHAGKYKMLYCFSCNKSICMDCFTAEHNNHKVEEKADYLAPSHLLMNNIFSNSSLYRADSRLSKYMECVNFRSNLKLNIFDNLRKMLNELEIKFASCLEYFSSCEDETEKNTNENLELLKKYCIECFIKLKNDINTKGIIIDDEIFLTLYHKLKEIEKYKTEYFEENKQKYEKMNSLLAPFIDQVDKISSELKVTFDTLLNKELYEKFKNVVQENIVEKVQKETVNDFMFRNLGVPRKSLNKSSLSNYASHRKKEILKDSIVKKVPIEEKCPFNRANYSAQRNENNSGTIFGRGIFSNSKDEQKEQNKALSFQRTVEQKNRQKGLNNMNFNIKMDMDIDMLNDTSKDNQQRNKLINSNTNIINSSNTTGLLGNNMNNISSFNDKSIKEQTSLFRNISENNYQIQPQPQQQIQSNINNTQGNYSHEAIINSTQTQNIISHNIENSTTTLINNTQQASSLNSNNNNMFGGKLIDVLCNEIGKEQEKAKEKEKVSNVKNSASSEILLNQKRGQFKFMYPIFNSSSIIGVFSDENTARAHADLSEIYLENDLKLQAFPEGGSFCNYKNFLFFTGGKETQKGIGKLFLRITMNIENDSKAKIIKMPSMCYSHWNHSMIANENYIFVIGGYNSNKCEAFNMQTLKWESMPDLNSPERQCAMLFIYGDYLYAFMGYNQNDIMDSVERINITKKGNSKWENVIVTNNGNINLKFYGAGVYNVKDKLFFIGGKYGHGNEEKDYKSKIYCYDFNKMEFIYMEIFYEGHLAFMESQFHHCSSLTIGNMIDIKDGLLATLPVSALSNMINK